MAQNIKTTLFYIVLFFFILTISILIAENYDYDFWARLVAGMHVFQTGEVLKQDFLSYTPTHIWYDHEWGSSVIFYFTQHFFGPLGILMLQSLLVFSTFFIVSRIIKLKGTTTTSPYNFLFYFFSISTISYILQTPVRCQLFSFLFFAIFIYVLERSRSGISKNLELYISLPVLMIIWNNLHGGCVAGLGVIIIYIIGEFLNKKPVKKYIYALILTTIVLPINPWGFEYLKFLFNAATMKRPDIIEWWGLFSKFNVHKYLTLKLFLIIFALSETYLIIKNIVAKNFYVDKTKCLLLLTTLFLGIQHVKLVPLFVISAMCFFYDDFYTMFNQITFNIFNKISIFKDTLVYIIILFFIAGNLYRYEAKPILNFNKYPILSIEFIKINNLKGNLLTNFGLGSYAAYKLYPQNKIFIDGRYEEVYYDFMMPMLKNFHLMNPGWDEIFKKYPPDVMILENFYPIYKYLLNSKDWELVYDKDYTFGVFVRKKDLKTKYKEPIDDINYYRQKIFETNINFKRTNVRNK